jgi:hypothetical protein
VNRADYQNMTFVLIKNGKLVARLTPETENRCTGRELADALTKTELSADEACVWNRDLRTARKTLKTPAGWRMLIRTSG